MIDLSLIDDIIMITGAQVGEQSYMTFRIGMTKLITRLDVAAAQLICCFLSKCKDRLPLDAWDSAMHLILNHVPVFCERYYHLPTRYRIADFGVFLTCCELDQAEEMTLALHRIHRDTFEALLQDFALLCEMVTCLIQYDNLLDKDAPIVADDDLIVELVKSAQWWWNALHGSSALNRN